MAGGSDNIVRGFTALKIVVFLVLLIAVVTFVVKNMSSVDLYYYNYKFQLESIRVPLLVVILTAFASGLLISWFFGFVAKMQLKSRVRRQTKTIQDMNEEMQKLKSSSNNDVVSR